MLNEAQLHDQWNKNNQEHVESAFDFPKGKYNEAQYTVVKLCLKSSVACIGR